MRLRSVIAALVLLAQTSGAFAGEADCPLTVAEQVTVTAVIDGGSFELADGRRVRLEGIQSPMLSLGRSNVPDWPLAAEAKQNLSKLVLNQTVGLAFDERGTDRHGDVVAHVFADGTHEWLQSRLVSDGFARVNTKPDARQCAAALLAKEGEARAAKRGIWAHPFYRVRQTADLDGTIGTFQIVEGKVLSAVERRDRIFLNFGIDYRSDFTVTISPRDAKRMAKNGTDPLAWSAKRVRVRGWISLLNGPEMELTHPEQLEVLK